MRGRVMITDGDQQIVGPPVVQQEQALTQSPERRRAELVRAGAALDDIVGKRGSHVMHQQVRVQIHRLSAQRHRMRTYLLSGKLRIHRTWRLEGGCMAQATTYAGEQLLPALSAPGERRRSRGIHKTHELR